MDQFELKSKNKLLVTIALPYANGSLHLGHLIEGIQADIWVRWQRQQNRDCLFICGNDAHGTAIMLSAEKQGISPEEWIQLMRQQFEKDYASFLVNFDIFYTTHSPENKKLSELVFTRLKQKGDITTHNIVQAYDPEKEMFLADRFIRGDCPCCNAANQYGDNCEVCGARYNPTELKNARSTLSNSTPIFKESLHYFFNLENYRELLTNWITEEHLSQTMANKLQEWFKEELKPWDISRDAPYFGFKIPETCDKYFYVWLDAPIGYMAATQKICEIKNHQFEDYWGLNADSELYHFMGKDIIYFHALFWPAMLSGAGFRLPTQIFAHGFLTINGEKMSKSRGTFITAQQYLEHLNPEYLRYYVAAKLNGQVEDIDLNFTDFRNRINSDLVGKFVNLASRCSGFIIKNFNQQLSLSLGNEAALYQEFLAIESTINHCYQSLNYAKAIREIMSLADKANQYIDFAKPWILIKDVSQFEKVQTICTLGLNLFRILTAYLSPILPQTLLKVCEFLNVNTDLFLDIKKPLLNHQINHFQPLILRIDEKTIDNIATVIHSGNC